VVFGVAELIPLKQISTSLLERLNGKIRQHVAPLHRKTRSFARGFQNHYPLQAVAATAFDFRAWGAWQKADYANWLMHCAAY